MTKKFTEKEYQKITKYFDDLNDRYGMGLLDEDFVKDIFKKFIRDYDYKLYWQKLVAIMNPITRDWAHDQFVETEKKYRWKYKKVDEDGDAYWLDSQFEIIVLERNDYYPFTEKEIIEAGYNPDMFERELE